MLRRMTFGRRLALVATGALVLRLAYVVSIRNRFVSPFFTINGDGLDYHFIAQNLAEGNGFVSRFTGTATARPPLWSLYLAAVSTFGRESILSHQIAAALVGACTVVLVGLCGRVLAGERCGLVAAGLAAIYPGFWVYERALLAETLLLAIIAATILIVYRFRDHPSALMAGALGAITGVAALTRSEQVLVFPLIVLPVVLAARAPLRQRIGWLALAAVATTVVIMPWTAYNRSRFEEPVFLSTGLGNTLIAGNCDAAYYGELVGLYGPACSMAMGPTLGPEESKDQSTVDLALRRNALDYMSDHLDRLPVVMLAREGRIMGFFRPGQVARRWAAWSGSPVWAVWGLLAVSWLHIPAAVYGAVILRRRRVPVYPLLTYMGIVVLSSMLTIGDLRYRAAAEVPLVLLAAVGLVAVWPSREGSVIAAFGFDRTELEAEVTPKVAGGVTLA
jgi:4-amino-4-deoxy-L-arabinose transferase-like glycosyltransferase